MTRSAGDESVFQAIACPTRRALLDALALGESNVSDLVAALDVTQSAVSQQLALLKSVRLVEERAGGRLRYYRLRAELLAYSWVANAHQEPMHVTFTLEPHAGGTRLTFEHTGFTGVGGFLLAKLMMGPGWRKMLGTSIPAVLADLDEDAKLRQGSALRP